jgi:predicted nucleic acid-binding protein
MDFVLDTNILVYFIRSDEYIQQLNNQFALFSGENFVFVSIVSVGEIRSLAYQFGWGANKLNRTNQLLQALRPFPIENEEIVAAYAELDAFSQCCHPDFVTPPGMTARNMGKNDLWIAATTMFFNATLITTDSDFAHLSPTFFQVEKIEF